jgi:hypothetical protein
MGDALNEAQRNALVSVLRRFEDKLRQAGAWLDGSGETGTLYRRRLAIDAEQRGEALAKIDEALQVIGDLAQDFGLQPGEEDLLAKIRAEMTVCWADLYDTQSTKLQRYGSVDPRLMDLLDPRLDRLIVLASRLAALAAQAADG